MRTRGIVYNRNMYLKRRINTISAVSIRTLAASGYNCSSFYTFVYLLRESSRLMFLTDAVSNLLDVEFSSRHFTTNSNVYCRQLMKLDKEIKEKRPELETRKGVIFHQGNARPHTSLVTRKKLLELGWEVMPHPPYSSNLASSNYHLFRSLKTT